MNNKKVGFKEVWRALKQIPKTITIIRKVDKKGFTLIVMLSMIAGAFPVITLVLSQELINSIVKGKCCFDAYNNKKTFIE